MSSKAEKKIRKAEKKAEKKAARMDKRLDKWGERAERWGGKLEKRMDKKMDKWGSSATTKTTTFSSNTSGGDPFKNDPFFQNFGSSGMNVSSQPKMNSNGTFTMSAHQMGGGFGNSGMSSMSSFGGKSSFGGF
jgi:hypothetical protein